MGLTYFLNACGLVWRVCVGGKGTTSVREGSGRDLQAFESRCARKLDERGAIPYSVRALSTCHLGDTLGVAPSSGQGNSKTFHGKAKANPFCG